MRNVVIGCSVLFTMAQTAFSETKGPTKELAVDLGGGVKMEMVLVPAGSFMMGSDERTCDKPVHKATITKPFYLGKYEVTQEQWEAVMGSNPSGFKGPKNPVETVSWDDCQVFLVKLNAKTGGQGGKFVLPTEAQWEYACRAGSTTQYCFGDDEARLRDHAWYRANSESKTHPVGKKKPNAWGLYDMHGNVWEWCQDWYGAYGAEAVTDPSGPATGSTRVFRGGNWFYPAKLCRSAPRYFYEPGRRSHALGLRVALVPADK
jgi:formylglycine-generating enzyme required for sulfatase activity